MLTNHIAQLTTQAAPSTSINTHNVIIEFVQQEMSDVQGKLVYCVALNEKS